MVRHASGQSVSTYVHAVKQHFDDLNEYLQLKDGSMALHPHVLALVIFVASPMLVYTIKRSNALLMRSTLTLSCRRIK
jgi:hypothetical protein